MNRNFILSVYRELSSEFKSNHDAKLIAFDTEGYYYGLVYDVESLEYTLQENIYKSNELRGIVGDNLSFENICYDVQNDKILVNEHILKDTDAVDYALRQLADKVSRGGNIEKEVEENNAFVKRMKSFLSENGVFNKIEELELELLKSYDLKFHLLFVVENSISMVITEQQMCFMTSAGVVKLHDVHKDIDFQELVTLISFIYGLDVNELIKVIIG